MLTTPEVARLLMRYLEVAEAEQRVHNVAEDIAAVGFVLQQSRSVPSEKWRSGGNLFADRGFRARLCQAG